MEKAGYIVNKIGILYHPMVSTTQNKAKELEEFLKSEGITAFTRYATKMATGSGKTTVMGMLAAWSILNKINDRSDGRFSD